MPCIHMSLRKDSFKLCISYANKVPFVLGNEGMASWYLFNNFHFVLIQLKKHQKGMRLLRMYAKFEVALCELSFA